MLRLTPFVFLALLVFCACSSNKKTAGSSATSGGDTYKNTFSTTQSKSLDDNTFLLDSVSVDETYGYSKENPIHVGGSMTDGAKNQRRYLNALLGPGNEIVTYTRKGSCCAFSTKNGFSGSGLLDMYELTYEGLKKPIILYLNFYDYRILKTPKVFTTKK